MASKIVNRSGQNGYEGRDGYMGFKDYPGNDGGDELNGTDGGQGGKALGISIQASADESNNLINFSGERELVNKISYLDNANNYNCLYARGGNGGLGGHGVERGDGGDGIDGYPATWIQNGTDGQ